MVSTCIGDHVGKTRLLLLEELVGQLVGYYKCSMQSRVGGPLLTAAQATDKAQRHGWERQRAQERCSWIMERTPFFSLLVYSTISKHVLFILHSNSPHPYPSLYFSILIFFPSQVIPVLPISHSSFAFIPLLILIHLIFPESVTLPTCHPAHNLPFLVNRVEGKGGGCCLVTVAVRPVEGGGSGGWWCWV